MRGRSYVDYGLFGAAVAGGKRPLPPGWRSWPPWGRAASRCSGPTTGDIAAPGWGALYELAAAGPVRGLVFLFHCEDRDVIRRAAAEEAHSTLRTTGACSCLASLRRTAGH